MRGKFKRILAFCLALTLVSALSFAVPWTARAAGTVVYPQFLMTVDACAEETQDEPDAMVNAIDGVPGTFWHTPWNSAKHPQNAHANAASPYGKNGVVNGHWLEVDLGIVQEIVGIRYLTRPSNNQNGNITACTIYVSTDRSNYTRAGASSGWTNAYGEKPITFDTPMQGRYVLMVATSPTAYVNCGEFNVEVADTGLSSVWTHVRDAGDRVKTVTIGVVPGTYRLADQEACLEAIIDAYRAGGTSDEVKAAVDGVVEAFLASPIVWTKADLRTRIDGVKALLGSLSAGTTDGYLPHSVYDAHTALIQEAEAIHDNAAATSGEIGAMCERLVSAHAVIKAAVISTTPDFVDGNIGVYDLAPAADPDAIRFNNLEWTGNTGVGGSINAGNQSQVYEVNREKPHAVGTQAYDTLDKALAGSRDYARQMSKYYLPLTTAEDLDPETSRWTFSLVRTLTKTLATANATRDPLGGTQNIVDFYKPAYDATGWNKIAVPSSWQVQGIGTDGKPYTGWYDPATGYDPPYYTNVSMPGSITFRGTTYSIFNGVGIPGAPNDYNPVGFYRRTFDVPGDWIANKNKVFITFDGVEAAFYVYLNGKEVGYHEDSKTPGEFDLTPFLTQDGKDNLLAVKVFRWADCSWMDDQDFIRLGGIFRDVYLTATPYAHIRDYKVETNFDAEFENAVIDFRLNVRNYANAGLTGYGVAAQLFDADGVDILKDHTFKAALGELGADSEKVVTGQAAVIAPHKWFPDDPYLYTLVLTIYNGENVAVERISQQFGFKQVTFRDADNNSDIVRINGKKVTMRGVNRHDTSPSGGHYISPEIYRQDLTIMKRNNINTIRTAHYPNDTYLYYLADKYGIMIVAEANNESHANTSSSITQNNFYDMARSRVLNLVEKEKNRASVIMWSLGNESGSQSGWRTIARDLRQVDATLPVHYEGIKDQNVSTYGDRAFDVLSYMYQGAEAHYGDGLSTHIGANMLCEYAHAMGNSVGNLEEYFKAFRETPKSIGGCIWDYVDQAVWTKPTSYYTLPESGPYHLTGALSSTAYDSMFTNDPVYGRVLKPGAHVTYANSAGTNGEDIFNEKISGRQPFSVELWARPQDVALNKVLVAKGDSQFAIKTGTVNNQDSFEFYIYNADGENVSSQWLSAAAPIPANFTDGAMHRIVGTFDGSTLRLYYDNGETPIATKTIGANDKISKSGYAFAVGRDTQNSGRDSVSFIAGARVFTRVLSSGELTDAARKPSDAMPDDGDIIFWADFTKGELEEVKPQIYDYFENGLYLGYGGDWGEGNHDNYFCANGIITSRRVEEPEIKEVKKVYQSVNFIADESDLRDGIVRVRNEYYATDASDFDIKWTLYEDGAVIGSGLVDAPPIPGLGRQTILVNIPTVALNVPYLAALPGTLTPGAEYALKLQACLKQDEEWAEAGYPLSEGQFELTWLKSDRRLLLDRALMAGVVVEDGETTLTLGNGNFSAAFSKTTGALTSYAAGGEQLIISGPQPTFWRAMNANDGSVDGKWLNADTSKTLRSFGEPVVSADGKSAAFTVTYNVPAINANTFVDMRYTVFGTGAVTIETALRTSDRSQMFRFGVDFEMPAGYENIEWFTRGPWENLNDRLTGSFSAKYRTTVADNFFPYIKPQDTGTHQGTRYMALTGTGSTGLLVAATGDRLFEANAQHYSWRDINATNNRNAEPKHPYQLQPRETTIVSVSYGSRGTGGASCGPETLPQYTLTANNLSYSYTLMPFTVGADDPAVLARYYREPVLADSYELTAAPAADGVEALFANNTDQAVSVELILAVYAADGRLARVETKNATVDAWGQYPAGFAVGDESRLKVFAWDAASHIPLCEAVSLA
ncbi:MAG: DUF4981 domain-containing protein [Oscillospiraceae bacterium]|nr:DUF4981 domain-containing protein [Oscillospiraceae bacterium]